MSCVRTLKLTLLSCDRAVSKLLVLHRTFPMEDFLDRSECDLLVLK